MNEIQRKRYNAAAELYLERFFMGGTTCFRAKRECVERIDDVDGEGRFALFKKHGHSENVGTGRTVHCPTHYELVDLRYAPNESGWKAATMIRIIWHNSKFWKLDPFVVYKFDGRMTNAQRDNMRKAIEEHIEAECALMPLMRKTVQQIVG